jgi:hypothetical protein
MEKLSVKGLTISIGVLWSKVSVFPFLILTLGGRSARSPYVKNPRLRMIPDVAEKQLPSHSNALQHNPAKRKQ